MIFKEEKQSLIQLHNTFTFRSDINVLFKRNSSQTILLKNDTSVKFAEELFGNVFYEDALENLSSFYNVNPEIIENDLCDFIENINSHKQDKLQRKNRREGTPKWCDFDKIQFPLALEIEITRRCNWNCKFCYNIWKHSKKVNSRIDLPWKDYKKIIDEAYENGCVTIRLSGGEPTLHPEFKKFISYITEKGMSAALFTNASILDNEMVEYLASLNLQTVLISLHGLSEQHDMFTGIQGSFNTTIEKIKKLVNKGICVSVETILCGNMEDGDLKELQNLLYELNVANWNLMPFVKTGCPEDEIYEFNLIKLPQILKDLDKNDGPLIKVVCSQKLCLGDINNIEKLNNIKAIDGNCGSGIIWISISYDGFIRNCPHSNIYAGHYAEGIKNVYNKKMKPIVSSVFNTNNECSLCKLFDECKGGCHLHKIKGYNNDEI